MFPEDDDFSYLGQNNFEEMIRDYHSHKAREARRAQQEVYYKDRQESYDTQEQLINSVTAQITRSHLRSLYEGPSSLPGATFETVKKVFSIWRQRQASHRWDMLAAEFSAQVRDWYIRTYKPSSTCPPSWTGPLTYETLPGCSLTYFKPGCEILEVHSHSEIENRGYGTPS